MHIPDGFLDPKTAAGLMAAAAAALAYCLVQVMRAVTALVPREALAAAGERIGQMTSAGRRVLTSLGGSKLQRMGVVAAWIFAAQMFNFPVAHGTSGHLLGGVLAAVLLGPAAGVVVLSAVLMVQAWFFADGGVMALGANLFNIALVGSGVGYLVYAWLKRVLPEMLAVAAAAWFSVVAAASACALELGVSGTADLAVLVPAMLKVHVWIGLGEAVLTVVLVAGLRERGGG
jgi:cobalt/nickel transport system permease protein